MSQPAGTGTSAGAVRSGMATAVAAAAPTASSATAAAAAATPTTTEYRLRAASRALPRHHIAKLSVPRFSIAECVEPVHLYRGAVVNTINQFHVEQAAAAAAAAAGGPHAMAVDGPVADVRLGPDGKPETTGQRLEREREAIAQEIAPQGGASKIKRMMFKKRTQVFYGNMNDERHKERRVLRKRETLPWILEDGDGSTNMVGRMEGGQPDNYVFFVYENDGFTVIPAAQWYKFTQRITYRTLTTDEVEEQLKNKGKSAGVADRWFMHRKRRDEAGVAEAAGLNVANSKFKAVAGNGSSRQQNKADVDELLFEDIFEDDEEFAGNGSDVEKSDREDDDTRKRGQLRGDEEEDEDEQSAEMKRQRLQAKGKGTAKLLKKMGEEFLFGTADEEKDPYAQSDGEPLTDSDQEVDEGAEPQEMDEQTKKTMQIPSFLLGNQPQRTAVPQSSSSGGKPSSRSTSPVLAAATKPSMSSGAGKRKGRDSMGKPRKDQQQRGSSSDSAPSSRATSPVLNAAALISSPRVDSSSGDELRVKKKAKVVVGSPAPQGSVQQAKKIRAITDSDVRAWFAKESVLEIKDIPQLLRGSGLESRENKTLITEIIKAITKKVGKGKLRLK